MCMYFSESELPGGWSRLFCRESEPTQFGRLRELRLPEPEPPKKVTAPQHCLEEKPITELVEIT